MSRRRTGLTLAAAFGAALWAAPALADGDAQAPAPEKPAWAKALEGRNARYADLIRSGDAVGDQHEAFLLECAIERYPDLLGDFEERRLYRAFVSAQKLRQGRCAVIHARLAREQDHMDDQRQAVLAKLTVARRDADVRRLRDLGHDKLELTRWRRGELRYGPRIGSRFGIGNKADDPEGRRHNEDKLLNRVDQQGDAVEDRDERKAERAIEREFERVTRDERKAEQDEEKAADRDERSAERDDEKAADADAEGDERAAERDEERDEESAEAASERDEAASERDLERDMDAAEEQAIQNAEED